MSKNILHFRVSARLRPQVQSARSLSGWLYKSPVGIVVHLTIALHKFAAAILNYWA